MPGASENAKGPSDPAEGVECKDENVKSKPLGPPLSASRPNSGNDKGTTTNGDRRDKRPPAEAEEDLLVTVTFAMRDTLHYMKYRERLRSYNGEYKTITYAKCLVHIMLVFTVILLFAWMSSHFEPRTVDPVVKSENMIEYYLNNPTDLLHILFSFTLFVSCFNLYICMHPRSYFHIVIITRVTLVLYFALYPFLMIYNHQRNLAAGVDLDSKNFKMVFNARAYKILGPFFYDGLFLFIFSVIMIIINLNATIYRYLVPHALMLNLRQVLKSYRVTSLEKVSFDVPSHYLNFGSTASVKMVGYHIQIARNDLCRCLRSLFTCCCRKKSRAGQNLQAYEYIGQVNSKWKPHGFGYWRGPLGDSELLIGTWENGMPLGPFKSRELRTGSGFNNCLVGWIDNCFRGGTLNVGVAGLECCVSGSFFGSFPRAMIYKAHFIDTKDKADGFLKHLGKIPNEQLDEYITEKQVILRLHRVSNDIVHYRYGEVSSRRIFAALVRHKRGHGGGLIEKMKQFARKKDHCISFGTVCHQIDALLQALTKNSPNFVSYDLNEVHVSLDPCYGLNLSSFVPTTDVKRHESVIIKVERSANTAGGNVVTGTSVSQTQKGSASSSSDSYTHALPYCISGPQNKHKLTAEGWGRKQDMGYLEVMIFIHGFHVTCENALRIMGQVVSFGNYPEYIKPVVFSWPSGNSITHIRMAAANVVSADIRARFVLLLQSLAKNGVTDLHILTHSMGAKMFLDAFVEIIKSPKTANLFSTLAKSDQGKAAQDTGHLRLLTLTLFNPEYCLETFKNSTFGFIRPYCDHITIYSDVNDKILWVTETVTRKRRLGRAAYELYYTRDVRDLEKSGANVPGKAGSDGDESFAIADQRTATTTLGSIMTPFYLIGRGAKTRDGSNIYWLDVDVIDTTWLKSNVNISRHSYWFINREIAEDLRELIVCRKRARQRMARLDRAVGNVWVYRVAPTEMTGIYKHRF